MAIMGVDPLRMRGCLYAKDEESFSLYDFFFWIVLGVFFPALGGYLSLSNAIGIVAYLCAVFSVGEISLGRLMICSEMPDLTKYGIYIVFGSLVSGIMSIFVASNGFLYFLVILFILRMIKKKPKIGVNAPALFCLLPFIVMINFHGSINYALNEVFQYADVDDYYYVAIVESIRNNKTIFDALFHKGIPINYPPLPFVAAAQLADLAILKSQLSFYGVYIVILSVSACSCVAYASVRLHDSLLGADSSHTLFAEKYFLACLMLIFLGPLHFPNIIKGNWSKALLVGEGYLLPVGSPGSAAAIFLAGLLLLLVFRESKWGFYQKTIAVCLIVMLVLTKVALFLPICVFLGCVSLFRLAKGDSSLFQCLLIAFPITLLCYKLTIGSSDSVFAMELTLDGHFPTRFKVLGQKYFPGLPDFAMIIGLLFISLLMWINAKIFFITAVAYEHRRDSQFVSVLISALVALIISLMLGFFLDAYGISSSGAKLFSIKYDMGQFVKGAIFLVNIFVIAFILYFLFSHKKTYIRKLTMINVVMWMGVISIGFFSYQHKDDALGSKEWYTELLSDFESLQPSLMAMIGSGRYSGQLVSAAGINPWFCTGLREEGEGYVNSKTAYDRNFLFRGLFDEKKSLSQRKAIADSLKGNGVDYIVATPETIDKIESAVRASILELAPGAKWMYRWR